MKKRTILIFAMLVFLAALLICAGASAQTYVRQGDLLEDGSLGYVIKVTRNDMTNGLENVEVTVKGSCAIPKCDESLMYTINQALIEMNAAEHPIDVFRIDEGITAIGEGAFMGGRDIGHLIIADSVVSIGKQAFYNERIVHLTLGGKVRTIGAEAFRGTALIEDVLYLPESLVDMPENSFESYMPYYCTVIVREGSEAEALCRLYGWKYTAVRSPASQALNDLCRQVNALVDVPERYRTKAVELLWALYPNASRCAELSAYIEDEAAALHEAMRDNSLSVTEITGFVSCFKTKANAMGVTVTSSVTRVNTYPAVRLCVTIPGCDPVEILFYRTGTQDWTLNFERYEHEYAEKQNGPEYEWYTTSEGAVVTAYTGQDTIVHVPSRLGGSPVIAVASEAFTLKRATYSPDYTVSAKYQPITAIYLPEGLKYIEANAFMWMDELETVSLPSTLEYIGESAFMYTGITSPVLPDGLEYIGSKAFMGCTAIKMVEIPDSVTYLGSAAFSSCSALAQVRLSSSLTEIDDHTFFSTMLMEVIIPENVTRIGNYAFYGARIQGVAFENDVAEIGDYAFADNRIANTLYLPSSLVTIGEYAFAGNELTEPPRMPEGLETIGAFAFENSGAYSEVVIPSTVTSIGLCAFNGVEDFAEYEVNAGNTAYKAMNGILYSVDGKTLVAYPAYKPGTSFTTPASVTGIAEYAFCNNEMLTYLRVSEGVTECGEGAFSSMQELIELVLPSTLTVIPQSAAYGCQQLQELTLGANTVNIGEHAFADCGITYIDIPASVRVIGWNAFANCPITNLELHYGLEFIGMNAFSGCSVYWLSIPDSVRYAGKDAFGEVNELTVSASIGKLEKVVRRGEYLYSIWIPATVQSWSSDWDELDPLLPGSTRVVHGITYLKNGEKSCAKRFAEEYDFYFVDDNDSYGGDAVMFGQASVTVHTGEMFTIRPLNYNTDNEDDYILGWENNWVPYYVEYIGNDNGVLYFRALKPGSGAFFDIWDGHSATAACLEINVVEPVGSTFIIPENVTRIEPEAFKGTKAYRVVIPDGTTYIGREAFANCPELTVVEIPMSVSYIADRAFPETVYGESTGVMILCGKYSYAAQYAMDNGFDAYYTDTHEYVRGEDQYWD